MLKKMNMIIVAFFLILTINGGYLFSLYLPVMLFYLFKDKRNMYYIYPISLLSILLFSKEFIIGYLVLIVLVTIFLFLFKMGVNKDNVLFAKPNIIISAFILIINLVSFFLYPKSSINVFGKIIFTFLSILIYLFLDVYLYKLLKDIKNIKERFFINDNKSFHSYIYLEILICILTTIGASYIEIFNVNLSIIVGCYFAMYLSRKFKNIYSLLYSLVIVFLEYVFFKIDESLIIIVISGIYSVRSVYTIGILNAFLAIIIFSNTIQNQAVYIAIMGLSIVFEVLSYVFIKVQAEDIDEYKEIHQTAQKSVNEEILKFAGFLDRFVIGFQNPKGFNEKLSNGIKTIVDKHCKNCTNQKVCFSQNKSSLYPIFKDILMMDEDAIYNYEDFAKTCYKYPSILNTSKLLNERINYKDPNSDEKDANNYILLAQISGVSNALKNYVVDTTSKTELNYQNLYKAKSYLIELEYYLL